MFTAAEVADDAPALADENPIRFVEDDGTAGGRLVPSDIELIYEELRTQDASNRELTREARGTLTLEIWQRVSHPQFYLDASEPYVYHEEGGTTYLEDGSQRHHYRIRRQPNRSQAAKPVTLPGPPRVDAVVFERWAEAAGDGFIELNVRLSGIPDYQPPPIPPPGMFTVEDDRRAQAQRDDYLLSYYENFNTRAGRFLAEIEAAGGQQVELMPDIGWVRIRVPSRHVEHLLEHPEIDRLTSPYVETQDAECVTGPPPLYYSLLNCPAPGTHWLLGQGRSYKRLDAQKFHNAGIDGSITSARHGGLPRLQAGIVESLMFENESLALRDANLDTRVFSLTNCSVDPCTYPADYLDDQSLMIGGTQYWYEWTATHGTAVSSVLAGDFRYDQAEGQSFGDPNWDGTDPLDLTHCADWNDASTGMAPGAAVQYAYSGGGVTNAYARAYAKMRHYLVDVTNCSHNIGIGCNIDSDDLHEMELENGYDSGIAFIAASGNNHGGDACNLNSPADTPKAIAVSSLDAELTDCQSHLYNCVVDDDEAATGGMNAIINGTNYLRVVAGVDLLAPQYISNVTRSYNYIDPNWLPASGGLRWIQTGGVPSWPDGWNHNCVDGQPSQGSSIATPHVSGLALLLKHWRLSKGQTYYNYSGRLQALLLANADRWDPDLGGYRTSGVSRKSGFGRVKLRYLDHASFSPATDYNGTFVFYPSSTSVTVPMFGNTPVPTGVTFIKCVMFEPEDMSHKPDISDIYLQVNARTPDSNNQCTNSTFWGGTVDSSRDIRHMVARTSGVGGKCAELQIHKRHVTSSGAVVHVHCYYSSKNDSVEVAD